MIKKIIYLCTILSFTYAEATYKRFEDITAYGTGLSVLLSDAKSKAYEDAYQKREDLIYNSKVRCENNSHEFRIFSKQSVRIQRCTRNFRHLISCSAIAEATIHCNEF